MYKVNITDGNISSVIDDVSLIQSACIDNLKDTVKTIFSKYGLVLNTQGAFKTTVSNGIVSINCLRPIVFPDGYIIDPQETILSKKIPSNDLYDIYIVMGERLSEDEQINDTLEISIVKSGVAPINSRAIRVCSVDCTASSFSFTITDYRESVAAELERNPISTKSAPIISSITTMYNYDDVTEGRDFSHLNQRLAFLKIKWAHLGSCLFVVRVCPCNENGSEQKERAEYILTSQEGLLYEAIDGKKYSIKVQAKDEDGASPWSDMSVFIAGSDRKPNFVSTPQISAQTIRTYPQTVAISVLSGARDYPCYIELYKNEKLLYTGADSTIVSILDEGEQAFYKARVKGPNEIASELVSTGMFEGTRYEPDFSGQLSQLMLSIPISVSETVPVKDQNVVYKVQSFSLPLSYITKITFDSKGSYVVNAVETPKPKLYIEIVKANISSMISIDISSVFKGSAIDMTEFYNYYRFFSEDYNQFAFDPSENWIVRVKINTNSPNTDINVSGTLNVYYQPKHSWLA